MTPKAARIVVHGRVQGVFFRASARDQAERHQVSGWVRNRADGTVEIHAQGIRENLHRFLEWCGQGPPAANVTHLEVDWVSPEVMNAFVIR